MKNLLNYLILRVQKIAKLPDPRQVASGRKHGFRSGLERLIASQLDQLQDKYKNFEWGFETLPIEYYKVRSGSCWHCGEELRTQHTYSCDFILNFKNGYLMLIETKGWWKPEDRTKHTYIHKQHPEYDIRFVFNNPNARLNKKSEV